MKSRRENFVSVDFHVHRGQLRHSIGIGIYRYYGIYIAVILDAGRCRECRTAVAATVCCVVANLENNYVAERHYMCVV